MLAELGYAATNLTLWSERAWADLPNLRTSAAANGLAVAGVNVKVDVDAPLDHDETARVLAMIERAEGLGEVELALWSTASAERSAGSSPSSAEDRACRLLDAALAAAAKSGVRLLLYPHTHYWLDSVRAAVRLCRRFDGRLGLVFSAFHWYAADREDLPGVLAAAAPFVRAVNTSGSRDVSGQYFPATIEPIGDGEFDNFTFLGLLREIGYDGLLGVQGYGIGGDAYVHFRRSRDAIRDIEGRLDHHPHWARLRPDHL
jgi:sugar phosphate isomerase/epimerase